MGGVISLILSIPLLLTAGVLSAMSSAAATDKCGDNTKSMATYASILGIVSAVILFMIAVFIPVLGVYIAGALSILALFTVGILNSISSASAGDKCPDKAYDMATYSALIGILGGVLTAGAMFAANRMESSSVEYLYE